MLDKARLEVLINRYFNQMLTPREREQLEVRLESSAEARAMFWEQANIHSLMREWALELSGQKLIKAANSDPDSNMEEDSDSQMIERLFQNEPPTVMTSNRRKLVGMLLGIAACFALAFVANRMFNFPSSSDSASVNEVASGPSEVLSSAVAVVTGVEDVISEDSPHFIFVGKSLGPGMIKLQRGFLQIDFHSGARLLLEGPAELNLISAREVSCLNGRLTADVPPQARGFRINTPGMDIVDLGTSFGVNVNPDQMEVHVFEGEVELHEKDGKVRSLYAGQAELATEGIPSKSFASLPEAFSRSSDFQNRFDTHTRQRHQQWLQDGELLNHDPSLRIRFDFEGQDPNDNKLLNKAVGDSAAGGGILVGGAWTEGRWPGKSALAFSSVDDRIRLSVPDKMESVTLAAWVKINSTGHFYNSLCMTDDFLPGALHWQIRYDQRPLLGICKPDGQYFNFECPEPISREMLGKWLHLAVVYDNQSQRVCHYINGSLQSEELIPFSQTVNLGIAEIGNWNPRTYYVLHPASGIDRSKPIRNLSGSLDEFAIFTRALSNHEVEQLYRQGAP